MKEVDSVLTADKKPNSVNLYQHIKRLNQLKLLRKAYEKVKKFTTREFDKEHTNVKITLEANQKDSHIYIMPRKFYK